MLRRSYWRIGMLLLMSALALIATGACDDDEKTAALARAEVLEQQVANLEREGREVALQAEIGGLEGRIFALQSNLDASAQNLFVSVDPVGAGCVRTNQVLNDGDGEIYFRVKVYDPATGELMDDTVLDAVVLTIGGETLDAGYGPHGRPEPTDYFWVATWEVPKGYPTGTARYSVTATAADGRTGEFTEFNVTPSLITVQALTAN